MKAGTEEPCPVRFVVVATLLRGVLETPEVLDDANQWRAFSAWREDESRDVRVEYELGAERRGDAMRDTFSLEEPLGTDVIVVWASQLAKPVRDASLGVRKGFHRRVG